MLGYSNRDYGNRIGFWRMLEPLDKHGIRCTISLNVAVLEHFPEIAQAMVERDYDFMSHGIYNTRYLVRQSEEEGAGVLPGHDGDGQAAHRQDDEGDAGACDQRDGSTRRT